MDRVKVAHCLGQLNTGGAETLVMNIFRHIDRSKYQFDFLLFNDEKGFYDEEAKSLGANLFYVPSMRKIGIFKYIKQMIIFFKNNDIDIVHSHMDWQGGFIAYAAHKAGIKKIVVHSHANQKMFESNIIYKIMISINKYLIKKYATDCVACSKEAGKSLFKKDFDVLINGIDLDKFLNPNQEVIEKLKNEFQIKDTDIVLGNVGSLSENKNQSFLIELLYELNKKNKNYKLILVGNGSMKTELIRLVNQLGVHEQVIFAGVRKEIPEMMSLFDIFLFPSKKEGLGIVAIEAQTSGLNCIVSDSIPKQCDMGLSLVYRKPLVIKEWVDSILSLKKEKVLVDRNKLLNSNFNIERNCEQLEKIYMNL